MAEPILTGKLEKHPLEQVLAEICRKRGTARLTVNSEKNWIALDKGGIVGAGNEHNTEYLGNIFFELGIIDKAQYQQSLDHMAKTGRRQGEALVEMGLTNDEGVRQALQRQARYKALKLFMERQGSFLVWSGLPGDLDRAFSPVDAYGVVLDGVRRTFRRASVVPYLARLRGRMAQRLPEWDAVLAAVELSAAERYFLTSLTQKPAPFEPWFNQSLDLAEIDRLTLLYFLLVTQGLKTSPGIEAEKTAAPPPAAASGSTITQKIVLQERAEIGPWKQELAERLRTSARQDYFALLGVSRAADFKEIRTAHFALARRFHPDSLAPELRGADADTYFARVNLAFTVLSDPQTRAEYESTLATEAPSPAQLAAQREFETAQLVKRGAILLHKNLFAQATAELENALRLTPGNLEAEAHLAWCRYANPAMQSVNKDAQVDRALKSLAARDSDVPAPFFYLGLLNSARGDLKLAEKYFRKVIELDPEDREAHSHLRVIRSRLGK